MTLAQWAKKNRSRLRMALFLAEEWEMSLAGHVGCSWRPMTKKERREFQGLILSAEKFRKMRAELDELRGSVG